MPTKTLLTRSQVNWSVIKEVSTRKAETKYKQYIKSIGGKDNTRLFKRIEAADQMA